METNQLTEAQKATLAVLTTRSISLGLSVRFLPKVTEGRRVACYRLQPLGSTRASHIEGIADDLALALQVESVLVRSLPAEGCVGIFVPRPAAEVKPTLWRDLVGAQPK